MLENVSTIMDDSRFQILPFEDVLKPFTCNKNFKMIQLEKNRTQGLVTEQFFSGAA
jgi:hypothetical protein